uniref:Nibrin n=1 Tax=Nothobranchius furzeri TaxID=105023 RepID=A0A1A8APW8_NOTFU
MWILTPLQPEGETHYLLPGKEYVVGRKNCPILLPNDQSISRAHAHLTATDQTLSLRDASKYGTFVNNQRLTAPVNLTSGDSVTFGVFHSKFTVSRHRLLVCSSCLESARKTTLSQALAALGGKLVNTWSQECTHLTMPTVKVTVKTISALLCCRPIVKPEFFSELSNAVRRTLPLPKAERFIPEIDEPSLTNEDVNLSVIPGRQQLFSGKTFLFLTAKQLKRLSAAVSFGGGRSRLLDEGSLPHDLLESPHSCVVDVAPGSSQTLLPPSSAAWACSMRSILRRKGLRVITESEIGLAAIYASCDKYCNPSWLMMDSDSAPKVKPRIPSASLSQSIAVDETVLPAASQNITAYAVNTETSQRYCDPQPRAPPLSGLHASSLVVRVQVSEAAALVTVGETPERKQNTLSGSKPKAQMGSTSSVVADTVSSSFSAGDVRDSQRKKPAAVAPGQGASDVRLQPSASKTNRGTGTALSKQSPKKLGPSPQTSPQKQLTLTGFFQPFKKKRPLEDDLSAATPGPKRPAPESSVTEKNSATVSEEMPSLALGSPPAVPETLLESHADLFVRRSEPQSRKRKEMGGAIQIEELESIMSEDMDDFDDVLPASPVQQEQPAPQRSGKQKKSCDLAESSSKKQRVSVDERRPSRPRPRVDLKKESGFLQNQGERAELHIDSVKTEPLTSAACSNPNAEPSEEEDASFIEDVELLRVDLSQLEDESKPPIKPVKIKQEAEESKMDEGLPKKLVLVEFRSLTLTPPTTSKPKRSQENGHVRNFKRFHKNHVPGLDGFPHIIGGSDLLVHNRGKNSDLDEWLKDAAEEERQNKQDETAGDDLFRYNPTKLAKRR